MTAERPRVLFLVPAAGGGGAEAALGDLLAALHAARPKWSLAVLALENGPLLEQARSLLGSAAAASVLRVPAALRTAGRSSGHLARIRAGWAAANVGLALRHWLRGWNPDLVHSNGLKTHLLSGFALSRPWFGAGRRPALVWQLHDYPGAYRRAVPALRILSRPLSLALTVSESVARDARTTFGQRMMVRTAHNAIDLDRFTPAGPACDLDAAAGLPPAAPGTVRVGLVATFARWKGHATFLRAAATVLRHHPAPVRFYVIGGPIYATMNSQHTVEDLRTMASAAGLTDTDVGFTGFLSEVPAVMRALDVVVHASTEPEPFGLVVAQALACARALVTSRLGGAAEIVEPGVNALTHRAGDEASLAEAIGRLVGDAALRTRLGATGHAGSARFSRERLAAEVVPLYEGLMASR